MNTRRAAFFLVRLLLQIGTYWVMWNIARHSSPEGWRVLADSAWYLASAFLAPLHGLLDLLVRLTGLACIGFWAALFAWMVLQAPFTMADGLARAVFYLPRKS